MSITKKRIHFVVTGHVDHGKSTFIGRLMHDIGVLPKDRFKNLQDSLKSPHSRIEFSHLTDALADEKAKGITISVSQTVFSYDKSEFVFLDSPGHHEFLQNMVTGASKADLAFLMVDAKEGIMDSTIRHLNMLSFLQLKKIVVLVNKMDLVNYSEESFLLISKQLQKLFSEIKLSISECIPICAYTGENLNIKSSNMKWYKGPLITDILKSAQNTKSESFEVEDFCLIVHDVYDKTLVGEISGAQYEKNTKYLIHQTGQSVELIPDPEHFQGQRYVSFKYENQNSIKRGDIIVNKKQNLIFADNFTASAIWFGAENIALGSNLIIKLAKQEALGTITGLINIFDSASLQECSTNSEIKKGSIFNCKIKLQQKISFASFEQAPQLGRFVIIYNGRIGGAGKINIPAF